MSSSSASQISNMRPRLMMNQKLTSFDNPAFANTQGQLMNQTGILNSPWNTGPANTNHLALISSKGTPF